MKESMEKVVTQIEKRDALLDNVARHDDEPLATNEMRIVGSKWVLLDKDLLSRWLDSAEGRRLTLDTEPDNQYDKNAVAAVTWFEGTERLVGHVAKEHLPIVYKLFELQHTRRLKVRVLRRRNTTLTVVPVANLPQVAVEGFYTDKEFLDWKSPVPDMPVPKDLVTEWYLEEDILSNLTAGEPETEEDIKDLHEQIALYMKLSRTDLSVEARQNRLFMSEQLAMRPDAEQWREEIKGLRTLNGIAGTEMTGDTGRLWTNFLSFPHTDYKVPCGKVGAGRVLEALEAFPQGLWQVYKDEREAFIPRLFYQCVPRRVLWSFLSTIVYYDMMTMGHGGDDVIQGILRNIGKFSDKALSGAYEMFTVLRDCGTDVPQSLTAGIHGEILHRRELEQRRKAGGVKIDSITVGQGGTLAGSIGSQNNNKI